MQPDDHLRLLADRCREQRLARNWTQQELADRVGCSRKTIVDFEGRASGSAQTLAGILEALGYGDALAHIVPPVLPSPIQQLDAQKHRRQRARPATRVAEEPGADWHWGEEQPT